VAMVVHEVNPSRSLLVVNEPENADEKEDASDSLKRKPLGLTLLLRLFGKNLRIVFGIILFPDREESESERHERRRYRKSRCVPPFVTNHRQRQTRNCGADIDGSVEVAERF